MLVEYKEAFPLLERAGYAGDTRAQMLTAYSYNFGYGIPVDRAKALHWFRLAAAGVDTCPHCAGSAKNMVANYYMFGWGGLKPDKATAIMWYRAAAQVGDEVRPEVVKYPQ